MNDVPHYPRTVRCGSAEFELRLMDGRDQAAALEFAKTLPPHDLLFLQRDIRNPKVVAAWIEQIERGLITSLVAVADGKIHACTAIVRDALSWSPHVAELRVVVSPHARGDGLGRLLVQDAFSLSLSLGVEKIIARMTPDQRGAIAVFEELGFSAEALLRDHVRDADGNRFDLVVLSLGVASHSGLRETYGYNEAF